MLGHLHALLVAVPGQAAPQLLRQALDGCVQGLADLLGRAAVQPCGRAMSNTNRFRRSTSVASALGRVPKTTSPSPCPGTA